MMDKVYHIEGSKTRTMCGIPLYTIDDEGGEIVKKDGVAISCIMAVSNKQICLECENATMNKIKEWKE